MIWGVSSYSLFQAMKDGRMTIEQAIEWTAEQGARHIEIVPRFGFDIEEPGLIARIRERAEACGLAISNYAVGGSFISEDEGAYEAEIEKLLRHVDIAAELGTKKLRHDVAWRSPADTSIERFESDLPRLVLACRTIADYAAQYDITTSIENHGYHVQGSDRVLRLYHAVNRSNFKITMDIGNFMCVDEDSLAAVKKVIPYASMVHLKDFYMRPEGRNPGSPFFQTTSGNYLRGAIVGHGDLKLREILKAIYESGYGGYASIEFEGIEDCLLGTQLSMNLVQTIWKEIEEEQR